MPEITIWSLGYLKSPNGICHNWIKIVIYFVWNNKYSHMSPQIRKARLVRVDLPCQITKVWYKAINNKSEFILPCVSLLSRFQLFVTPWTVAYEATLSMGFSRQKYWSGVPFLLQGIFLSPALQADGLPSKPPGNRANMGVKVFVLSCIWLFETPWTIACQAPLSMGFSMQESWSG